VSETMMNTVQPLISFIVFQSDLIVFLTEHGLDTAIATDVDRYGLLLFFYIGKIEHTPLQADASKLGLTTLDTIRVARLPLAGTTGDEPGHRYLFSLRWAFEHKGRDAYEFRNEIWCPLVAEAVQLPLIESTAFWAEAKLSFLHAARHKRRRSHA
jgi:hypothetical protein